MRELFLSLLHMSLTASYCIFAVLLIRFLLQKAPKKYSYYLWSVVAFRLCCPVSFSSALSLFNIKYLPLADAWYAGTSEFYGPSSFAAVEPAASWPDTSTALTGTAGLISALENAVSIWSIPLAALWFIGASALVTCGFISYIRLAGKLRTAIRLKDNVFQSEYVYSPFILGLAHPKIYIPFHLDGQTLHYVLRHENYHLQRHDHILKTAAFLLLAVHWFNPLCWLSFHFFCRDMEMSCDEHVLAQEENTSGDYSDALLSFALRRRFPSPGPLAFGETDIRKRILHILNWKRPRFMASLLSAAVCLAVIFVCAADPAAASSVEDSFSDPSISSLDEPVQDIPDPSVPVENGYAPETTDFSENGHDWGDHHGEDHHTEGHH